jgi:hypothetical protein
MVEYTVTLGWDSEAQVWIAESDDITGLILESGSVDALIERLKSAVPELLYPTHGMDTLPPKQLSSFQDFEFQQCKKTIIGGKYENRYQALWPHRSR